jgi:hypothetical protein
VRADARRAMSAADSDARPRAGSCPPRAPRGRWRGLRRRLGFAARHRLNRERNSSRQSRGVRVATGIRSFEVFAVSIGCLGGPGGGTRITGAGHLLQAQPCSLWQVSALAIHVLPHALPLQQTLQQVSSAAGAEVTATNVANATHTKRRNIYSPVPR